LAVRSFERFEATFCSIHNFGWTESEVQGYPSPVVQRDDIFSNVISGAVYVSVEVEKTTRDNRQLPVSITASPIYSSSQLIVGATYIYRDMTDKKRVEDMVLRSEKLSMAGELAAGIAHEIRNPLTSIQGFLQLMETSYEPSYLPILLSEVHRINSMTNELLLLAKPQVDTFESEDMISIIDEVLTLMRTQANLYSIIIHQNVEKSMPAVECVRDHMKHRYVDT
jgi:two-component system, sporulation sensor kinase E